MKQKVQKNQDWLKFWKLTSSNFLTEKKTAVQEHRDALFHESKRKPSFFHVKKKFVKKKSW